MLQPKEVLESSSQIESKIHSISRDEAIEWIMDHYGEEIKRLVFTYIKDWSQTDDITQEVFVTVYLKLETFEGKSALKTWIYTIAINKCKDYLKSWHYRNLQLGEAIMTIMKDKKVSPDEQIIQKEQEKSIIKKVMNLPVKYREILTLYYFKELSIKEISSILQMSEATVKTRLSRGRQKLSKDSSFLERGEFNG